MPRMPSRTRNSFLQLYLRESSTVSCESAAMMPLRIAIQVITYSCRLEPMVHHHREKRVDQSGYGFGVKSDFVLRVAMKTQTQKMKQIVQINSSEHPTVSRNR